MHNIDIQLTALHTDGRVAEMTIGDVKMDLTIDDLFKLRTLSRDSMAALMGRDVMIVSGSQVQLGDLVMGYEVDTVLTDHGVTFIEAGTLKISITSDRTLIAERQIS